MESTNQIIQQKTYEHMRINKLKHMSYDPNKVDDVVDQCKHLRADESYRKLHCYHANRLGADKFIQLAKTAEQEGKNPARYFSWLLKNES